MSGKDSQAAFFFLSGSLAARTGWTCKSRRGQAALLLGFWLSGSLAAVLAGLAVWHGGWAGLAAGQARHAGIEEARLPSFFLEGQAAWLPRKA